MTGGRFAVIGKKKGLNTKKQEHSYAPVFLLSNEGRMFFYLEMITQCQQ